jgi:hypothetical protein
VAGYVEPRTQNCTPKQKKELQLANNTGALSVDEINIGNFIPVREKFDFFPSCSEMSST